MAVTASELRRLRAKRGETLAELARALRVSPRALARWEAGIEAIPADASALLREMSGVWEPQPDLWRGAEVVVLATGPSLTEAAAEAVRGLPCVAVNASFRRAPWAAMLVAHDAAWWEANPEAQAFEGVKLCGQPGAAGALEVRMRREVVQLRPGHTVDFASSGLLAIRIAVACGAARIRLLGFDPESGEHWHRGPKVPEHLRGVWAAGLRAITEEFAARGIEVSMPPQAPEEPPAKPRRAPRA